MLELIEALMSVAAQTILGNDRMPKRTESGTDRERQGNYLASSTTPLPTTDEVWIAAATRG